MLKFLFFCYIYSLEQFFLDYTLSLRNSKNIYIFELKEKKLKNVASHTKLTQHSQQRQLSIKQKKQIKNT